MFLTWYLLTALSYADRVSIRYLSDATFAVGALDGSAASAVGPASSIISSLLWHSSGD